VLLQSAPALCFVCHTVAVNDVAVCASGEFVASCANDRKVCVVPLDHQVPTLVRSPPEFREIRRKR